MKLRGKLVAAALLAGATPSIGAAQTVGGAPRSSSVSTAVIGFLTSATPAVPTLIPKGRAKCSPGECYSQLVAVKANATWRLQVRLAATPVGFSVALSAPASPATVSAALTTATWVNTPLTGTATKGTTGEVTFYTAKLSGPSGKIPSAAELAAVLQYQVVRTP